MRKILLVIISCLMLCARAHGQVSQWEQHTIELKAFNIFVIEGDELFVGIGSESPEFWSHDLVTGVRRRRADFPGRVQDGATFFFLDSMLFVVGGRSTKSGLQVFPDVWMYNPNTDEWTAKGIFPGGERYNAISFVVGGKAFVGMGYNGTYLRDLWSYDIKSDSWTELSQMPRAAKPREAPFAFTLDGKGYVGGGKVTMDPYESTRQFWEYDPAKDAWAQKQDFPIEVTGAGAFTQENRAYVVGGLADGKPSYACWSYHPCQNQWIRQQDIPEQKSIGIMVGMTSRVGNYAVSDGVNEVFFWRFNPGELPARPMIEDVTPSESDPGESIQITGSNFSIAPEENVVLINGQVCKIVSSSVNELTVLVPETATTGPLQLQVNCSVKAGIDAPFVVLEPTPWWRRWWAFIGYAGVAVALVFAGRVSVLRSERKKLQKQLEEKEAEALRKTEQLKAKFFSNITHEFRTPLSLIKGPAQELYERAPDAKSQKLAQLVGENADRLLKLINQLLDLAKLDAKEMKLNLSVIDLDSRFRSIHAQFASLAASRNIDFRKEFHLLPTVMADNDKLEVILNNLLSNAIKFTAGGGRVTLEARYEAGRLHVHVADTGRGIPEEQLPFIFNRFYQVNPSDSSHAEGTGIGLALVREYTELMGGVIRVESRLGEGTIFQLVLPLAPSAERALSSSPVGVPTEAREDSKEDAAGEADQPLILLVEDNHDIRAFVKECLGPGYRYAECADGNAGLNTAQELIPDLILCDWMMPGMDGLEVCTRVKRDPRTNHIPLVMLTAKAAEENKLEGLKGGADDYLVKPFLKAELKLKIGNLLQLRENLQAHIRRDFLVQGKPVAPQSDSDRFVCGAREFVEKNLGDNLLSVERLAEAVHLSREQCYRKLMALTGLSPSAFIRTLRLQRAMELLRSNWGPVSQVAYEVGFDNLSYFSKAFHAHFGHLPSEVERVPNLPA